MTKLPQRPHIQPRSCNGYVGGVLRTFAPLEIIPDELIHWVAQAVPLASAVEWQVDVHQWRTVCQAGQACASVPEGPHRDGHSIGAVLVVAREGVEGGVTSVLRGPGREVVFAEVLQPGTGLVFDDRRLLHYTTALQGGLTGGWRDIFVLDFNSWEERHYGPDFERWALGQVSETP